MALSPPWGGPAEPAAEPAPDGHFDHLAPGTRAFELAHLYGCVRFVLDVWERFLGRPVRWHFADDFRQLELLVLRGFDNAQAGYGFLEVGEDRRPDGTINPFALNFDVIAHEVGHLLLYGTMGVPDPETDDAEFLGFHESLADLVGLFAAAKLPPVVDVLLEATRGNLYVLNNLSRIAELAIDDQIRRADNRARMSDFAAGWTDEHDISEPLTGLAFDVFVDSFHELLVKRRLIPPFLDALSDRAEHDPTLVPLVQEGFDAAYARDPASIREALIDACDRLGFVLAATYQRIEPDRLSYAEIGHTLIAADRDIDGPKLGGIIAENLRWRQIGKVRLGPRLRAPGDDSHFHSARTVLPEDARHLRALSFRERALLARGGVRPFVQA